MIIASAIKFFHTNDVNHEFPQVWTGKRHADILAMMQAISYDKTSYVEGFWTDCDTFETRYEAANYMVARHYITREQLNGRTYLESTDIWPET